MMNLFMDAGAASVAATIHHKCKRPRVGSRAPTYLPFYFTIISTLFSVQISTHKETL